MGVFTRNLFASMLQASEPQHAQTLLRPVRLFTSSYNHTKTCSGCPLNCLYILHGTVATAPFLVGRSNSVLLRDHGRKSKSRCSCSMKTNIRTVFGVSFSHAGVHPFIRKPNPSTFNDRRMICKTLSF